MLTLLTFFFTKTYYFIKAVSHERCCYHDFTIDFRQLEYLLAYFYLGYFIFFFNLFS